MKLTNEAREAFRAFGREGGKRRARKYTRAQLSEQAKRSARKRKANRNGK